MNIKMHIVMPAVAGVVLGMIVALSISTANQSEKTTKRLTAPMVQTSLDLPIADKQQEMAENPVTVNTNDSIPKQSNNKNIAALEIADKYKEVPVLHIPRLSSFNTTSSFSDIPEPSEIKNFSVSDIHQEFYSEPLNVSASTALFDETGISNDNLTDPYLFSNN